MFFAINAECTLIGGIKMPDLIADLAKAKAIFQQRAILSALGVMQRDLVEQCDICGGHDCAGGLPCQTGDGV